MGSADWTGIALVITSVGGLVASAGAVWVGLRNSAQIKEVKIATDGMKDQLVTESGLRGVAEGNVQGRAEARAERIDDKQEEHAAATGIKDKAHVAAVEVKDEAHVVAKELKAEAVRVKDKLPTRGNHNEK